MVKLPPRRGILNPPNGGNGTSGTADGSAPTRRRSKRSDALANRERILDAAGDAIAEAGVDVPIHAIAERAGVGVATVYRNFVDRDALIVALAERAAAEFDAVSAAAAAAPTGWDGIVEYIDGVTAVYLACPWLPAIRARARRLGGLRLRWEHEVRAAIHRAWDEGSLRSDIDETDPIFVPTMLSALFELPEPMRSVVIARQRDLVLDGLRADGVPRTPPGGAAPSLSEVRASLRGRGVRTDAD